MTTQENKEIKSLVKIFPLPQRHFWVKKRKYAKEVEDEVNLLLEKFDNATITFGTKESWHVSGKKQGPYLLTYFSFFLLMSYEQQLKNLGQIGRCSLHYSVSRGGNRQSWILEPWDP